MQREDVLEAIESSYAAQKLWRKQTAKVSDEIYSCNMYVFNHYIYICIE